MSTGTLYLIPTIIAPITESVVLPADLTARCNSIKYYLAENIRTARRCLSAMNISTPIAEIHFQELNKNTDASTMADLMQPLLNGEDIGVMSEAGCPGIADPGAAAVAYAHSKNIKVVPHVGPSSIFLALMASGFSGQSFAFSGYLPIEKKDKLKAIRALEAKLQQTGQTQIFMETPYRNNQLLKDLVSTLHQNTKLCVAKNITAPDELIQTRSIEDWGKQQPELHKIPCIFLIGVH